ncbi:Uncharacterised protein [Klebsiella pneumoniae]|uniref:Uncharacterized protein n=1 Tax=Klebsiella pneumoniae TaxID=573 RepID=A0A447S3E0_KLEPN|nr:Uncharacterised protein [Klebsiella pneumoniae]
MLMNSLLMKFAEYRGTLKAPGKNSRIATAAWKRPGAV